MNSKVEIRREVEKLSSSYSANDLFSSPYFGEMLQATVTAVCEKLGRIPDIFTVCDENNELTAATQGQMIMLNTLGPLIRGLDTNWEKYVSNIGHVVHECGHVLFTDFENQNPMLEGWFSKSFSFYPRKPDIKGADEVEAFLNANPNFRYLYVSCMRRIVNTFEDSYVENRLRDNFDGLAVAGLEKANAEMYRIGPSLEESLESCLKGSILPITVADSILLNRYVCYKEPKRGRDLTEDEAKLLSFIEEVLKNAECDIKHLLYEQDGKNRCELFNRLLVKFFFLMPPPPENNNGEGDGSGEKSNEEGKGESSNSKGDYNQNAAQNFNQAGRDFEAKSGKSLEAKGNTSSIKQNGAAQSEQSQESKRESSKKLSESKEAMERELQRAIKEAVKSEVFAEDEKRHAASLKRESKEIEKELSKYTKGSTFRGYELYRGDANKESYRHIYSDVKASSRNLTRKINNILKDRESDSVESGFLMGQRFNASDVVRRDGKYFSRQLIPDGKPDVVFGILVDESGSMSARGKADTARKAAILLEDSLRNLGTPLMVVGHTERSWGTCLLNVYVDFDTNDNKDCFRLANIRASGGNIDGAAVSYICEKLLKRPERNKVLLVISDGLPAGSSFYNENPNLDTKEAVEKYRSKNIKVFGAVVDQFEQVSSIYGQDFAFDCRDSGALERELVKLIKRYVLMRN